MAFHGPEPQALNLMKALSLGVHGPINPKLHEGLLLAVLGYLAKGPSCPGNLGAGCGLSVRREALLHHGGFAKPKPENLSGTW